MSDPITGPERSAASSRLSSSSSNFAFLVHSQNTMPKNLPPNVDNKALARQKRKRTSPEDHAILEAQYQLNPKPDKATRLEIVKRVALGEKEVQIWFQNRRQNDRRKSRPLDPQEVHGPFRPFAISGPAFQGSQPQQSSIPQELHQETSVPTPPESVNSSFQSTSGAFFHGQNSQGSTTSQVDDVHPRAPFARPDAPMVMRLSMSLDGNAQVTSNADNQISPPKFHQDATSISLGRRGGLKRSQSAIGLGDADSDQLPKLFKNLSRRSSIGRSRDSRTWEFYCDGDARDSLTTQAERENRGSAAGAISLIRSRSNSSLQNSASRSLKSTKPEIMKGKASLSQTRARSKLSRATSSLGRLQNTKANAKPSARQRSNSPYKAGKEESLNYSPAGDSDKENWVPGTQTSSQARRESHRPATRKPILGQNYQVLSQSSSVGAYLAEEKRQAAKKAAAQFNKDKENMVEDGSEESEEIRGFMAGNGKSAGEDYDCVQGLLSLSQGAWQ